MKKKKQLSIGKLKEKADRKMQDFYRRCNPGRKCELCSNPYEVLHHFIHKSQSNYLRYELKNFVFVCNKCHAKFHAFPDPMYPLMIRRRRGAGWEKYIESHRHLIKRDNRKELEGIINL